MNLNLNIFLLSFIYFIGSSIVIYSQSCQEKLQLAREMYRLGNFYNIENMLSDCIKKKKYDISNETEARRLIILVAIFQDELQKAHKNIKTLLQHNPDFNISQTEYPELSYLMRSYRNLPIASIYFSAHTSHVMPLVANNFSLSMFGKDDAFIYSNQLSDILVGVTLGFEYYFYNMFYLKTGVRYNSINIKQTKQIKFNNILGENKPMAYFSFGEEKTNIEVPVSINVLIGSRTKQRNVRKFIPYVGLGISTNFLMASNLSFTSNVEGGEFIDENIPITTLRRKINYDIFGELGLKIKLTPHWLLDISTGYRMEMLSHSIDKVNYFHSNYDNPNSLALLTYQAGYADRDIHISQIFLNVSVQYIFYNPNIVK